VSNIVNLKTMLGCAAIVVVVWMVMPTSPTEKSVANLIDQFRGDAFYWNPNGEDVSYFDSWKFRHYEISCKILAAEMIGELGKDGRTAVPDLIEELVHGFNDIDTGDGILTYRSTIAIALGKIGDERAIEPLIEKLKINEVANRASSALGGKPVGGIGQEAVIEALLMFGPKAQPALPHLIALKENPSQALSGNPIVEQAINQLSK